MKTVRGMNHGRPSGRRILMALSLAMPLWLPSITFAAGCGVREPGACVDGAVYSFWEGLASTCWSIDAMFLQLAYAFDQLRVWVVETAFLSAYQALVRLIDPLIVPFATLALLLGMLLFFLMPLIGQTRLMNVRHVLTWTLLTPIVFVVAGQLVVQVEQLRVTVGAGIFAQVSQVAPGDIFGVRGTSMRTPTPLYGLASSPCGTGALTRPGTGVDPSGLRMDDLAAALLWADAEDVHCPDYQGPGAALPDAFYAGYADGPGYAVEGGIGQWDQAADRQAAIAKMRDGFTRTALGLIPALLAALESLLQLLLGLALVLLWVGVPLALVFIFFEDSAQSMVVLARQALGTLKTSWLCSFFLALVFAALQSAAQLGNAGAYVGFSLGALILVGYFLATSFRLLGASLAALNAAVLAGTPLSVSAVLSAGAGSAASISRGLGGAAVGGAALAAVGAAAYRQTGSGRYAGAALLGRVASGPGEVAVAMGLVQDEEVLAGLNAGGRSRHGARALRLQLQSDAKRAGADGLTLRQAAQERALARQLDAVQTDRWRALDERASAGVSRLAAGYDQVRSGQLGQALRGNVQRMAQAVGDRWEALRTVPAAVAGEVVARSPIPPATPAGLLHLGATSIAVAHDWLQPDQRYLAYHLDAAGHLVAEQPRPVDAVPAGAQQLSRTQVNLPRLLREGYTVQQNRDQTVTFWPSAGDGAGQARSTPQMAPQAPLSLALASTAGQTRQVSTPSSPGHPTPGGKGSGRFEARPQPTTTSSQGPMRSGNTPAGASVQRARRVSAVAPRTRLAERRRRPGNGGVA